MSWTAAKAIKQLKTFANKGIAEHSQRFFKTGKGEYGEGDQFLGIRVPVIRQQIKLMRGMELDQVSKLLQSKFHEVRLFAVIYLVDMFQRAGKDERRRIYTYYLENTQYINNWDLVDSSAHQIVGGYLWEFKGGSYSKLKQLAKSKLLWERRIAIMATFHFIKKDEYEATLFLADKLLSDKEDLMHKAIGWMLREVGNRNRQVEEDFLRERYAEMPRTMLRYAIEKFPEKKRKAYLQGTI